MQAGEHINTDTCIYRTITCMHLHAQTCVYTKRYAHTYQNAYNTCTFTCIYTSTHTHLYAYTYTHRNACIHTHKYSHIHLINMHTKICTAYTQTPSQIHTKAYTQTQTHICKLEMERTGNLMLGQIMKSPEIHWARAGIISFESFCGVGQSQGRVEYLPHFTVNRTKRKMMNLWVIGINHWFHAMCIITAWGFSGLCLLLHAPNGCFPVFPSMHQVVMFQLVTDCPLHVPDAWTTRYDVTCTLSCHRQLRLFPSWKHLGMLKLSWIITPAGLGSSCGSISESK